MTKHYVYDLATNRDLWDEYIDPSGDGGVDFETMSDEAKMQMIVELWPEDVIEDDEDGQRILKSIAVNNL